jgi:hypothetical protein
VLVALIAAGGVVGGAYEQAHPSQATRQIDCAAEYAKAGAVARAYPHAKFDISDPQLESTCHINEFIKSVEQKP